jgi:hypothetical protein
MNSPVPSIFVADATDGSSERRARATLGRFETWLRSGSRGMLVMERGLRPELADALRDVAAGAGVRVVVAERDESRVPA